MASPDGGKGMAAKSDFYVQGAITYGYICVWVFLSAGVILVNKYILAYAGFKFPIALTLMHMAFCSTLASGIIKAGVVDTVHMDSQTYIRNVLPIAALFSGTLWLGNAAYIYLSVSFIQMLKACMPITVFIVGCLLGTEKYTFPYAANMVVVAIGVATASYGELRFDLVGVMFQAGSIVTESFRLSLIQILLQSRGIKLNPVTTLYYIAPACFCFLCLPFVFIELPQLLDPETEWKLPVYWLLLSASGAFVLNMSVFLLIGRTSALTMNIAGVLKDWALILLSVTMYESPVAALQLAGYGVAFLGVCWYNYQKLQGIKANVTGVARPGSADAEKQPLLVNGNGHGKAVE